MNELSDLKEQKPKYFPAFKTYPYIEFPIKAKLFLKAPKDAENGSLFLNFKDQVTSCMTRA